MTTSPAPAVPAATAPRNKALRVLGALAQLAAMAVAGTVLFSILAVLLSLGLSLLLVLGIGALFLIAFIYVLYFTGWLEYGRADGLYDYGLPSLRTRRMPSPGFGGWLRMLWQQFIDGPMWRGVASAAIATVLGSVVLWLVGTLAAGIALLFSPLYSGESVRLPWLSVTTATGWAVVAGVVAIIVSAALLVGIAVLDGVLTRAILVPSEEAMLAERARTSDVQRAGAVRASEVERTRIERDLHDGVQPRLVSVGMTLGLAQQKIDSDPDAARELITEAHTSTKAAITELRQLARGIHASVLDDRGLDAALSALAARSHVPVHLDIRVDGRCTREAEAAVYFAIAESLTNAAKHSRASDCRVTVRNREDGTLWARVEDNGTGGARVLPGGGLDGIFNRIVAARGTVRLDSPVGGPTSLEVSVPCAS
ncbi:MULTISPECIES: histidine kinase [unclassified Microbacterium]|uniref:sensor histidine kinase n=1 Tax=unclassified Microbacterium TaxID=2609290 RepID=UPI00214C5219|nr:MULTISPECIES: histidine kinase [unclassified Microbacterium]MCR2783665.1 histidine kinase [Microbacterium sp. zg.B96]WIM15477.1 histidine kinase [Microbacterium sp. zg-B96]